MLKELRPILIILLVFLLLVFLDIKGIRVKDIPSYLVGQGPPEEVAADIAPEETEKDALGVLQDIYKKYDNGEIEGEMANDLLGIFEIYVNHVNDLHDILDEAGAAGNTYEIELREDE